MTPIVMVEGERRSGQRICQGKVYPRPFFYEDRRREDERKSFQDSFVYILTLYVSGRYNSWYDFFESFGSYIAYKK